MIKLNYQRVGTGQAMVLIHGTGSHLQTWKPVLPALAAQYDVFAIDLPGFGDSPPLPEIDLPTPARLAELLATFLDDHGVEAAHIVGNSTGGTIGFEMAKLGRARSVTAFSPMGLWAGGIPLRLRYTLSVLRHFARAIRPFYDAFAGPWRRTPIMISMYGRPWLLPDDVSRAAVVNLANSPGYSAAIRGLLAARRFEGGKDIDVPITVAFGARDLGLREKACRRNADLPAHTRWMTLRGCGHVPMFDDPELVARVILECAARSSDGEPSATSRPGRHLTSTDIPLRTEPV